MIKIPTMRPPKGDPQKNPIDEQMPRKASGLMFCSINLLISLLYRSSLLF